MKICIRHEKPRTGEVIWKHGTLLSRQGDTCKVGIGEPHYFNYQETEVPAVFVKQFIAMSQEEAAFHHAADLVLAFETVQNSLAKLMPGEKVKIVNGSIQAEFGGLTLDPVIHEVHSIAQVKETPLWQVCLETYCPGSYHEPPSGDVTEIGNPMHWQYAVALFVEELFKIKANAYWEQIRENEYARDFAA